MIRPKKLSPILAHYHFLVIALQQMEYYNCSLSSGFLKWHLCNFPFPYCLLKLFSSKRIVQAMNALHGMDRYWKEVVGKYTKELYKCSVSLRYYRHFGSPVFGFVIIFQPYGKNIFSTYWFWPYGPAPETILNLSNSV